MNVSVVRSDGRLEPQAKVTFSLDGGDEKAAECVDLVDDKDATAGCNQWVTSYEQAGHFVIKATSEGGAQTAQAEVTVEKVEEDECHVVPEVVTLTLQKRSRARGARQWSVL